MPPCYTGPRVLAVLVLLARGAVGGTVFIQADSSNANKAAVVNVTKLAGAGGGKNAGFLVAVTNGHPHFGALPPYGGHPCGVRTKTSVTAGHTGCVVAVNGGPFNMDNGNCIGVLVHNGKVLEGVTAGEGAVFGKTSDGRWLLGDYDPATSPGNLDVPEALSGFGWLVQNGSVLPAAGGEVAPRTAVGVDAEGRLVFLEVDGCEKCPTGDQGLTLRGAAELLLLHGVTNAINLDGGGSSSLVINGSVANRPTCVDTWLPVCERAVTTVVCVGGE